MPAKQLRPDEPGLAGVRRILQYRVAKARDSLRKTSVSDADIHDARKQLKKARAALRLLRDSVGRAAYRRENEALRDAARPLSAARDGTVLLAALDDLVQRNAPAADSMRLDEFRRVLSKEQTTARQSITPASVSKQSKALHEVGARIEQYHPRGKKWKLMGRGLRRVYRDGKQSMRVAARSRSSADLHDWRKRVKYLWHQLQILEPIWPPMLGELAAQTHKLARHLGDDHDLAVLRQKIMGNAAAFATGDRDTLIKMLNHRRRRLQNKAFKLGERIFEEQPRRFTSRIGSYWRLWRAG